MVHRTVRFANLMLAGMLAGNEFGMWAAVHPSLEKLGPPERIRAEQELTRRFAAIMPAWMGPAIVSCVLALLSSRGSAGLRGTPRAIGYGGARVRTGGELSGTVAWLRFRDTAPEHSVFEIRGSYERGSERGR